ncbi:MAG: hypothetical protein IJW18_02120 [Lachnospiraceae bacterium]|nr:hypothetical protein [Lachnospiraceae bacterium]
MSVKNQITLSNIKEISAIYFALLQSGYDYFATERSSEHTDNIRRFVGCGTVPSFFSGIRQNTCKVYPYWPRAAMLETASFYLSLDHFRFQEYDAFREFILSAGNIADYERDQSFWDWVEDFPIALSEVLSDVTFQCYLEWENKWIIEQNNKYEKELNIIKKCLDICVERYSSSVQDIQIVINPIKCVYSADYHLKGKCFIFSSGAFNAESVIHEFLHHVIHNAVSKNGKEVLTNKKTYPGIDDSYYLSGDSVGQLNAFEEYVVRKMTKDVLALNFPEDIDNYIEILIREL